MNTLFMMIADKIWEHLQSWLEKKWEEVKPKLFEFVKDQFEEWLPKILKTVVVGTAQSAGQLVVDSTDKVTDVIPGKIDDYVIDTIVDRTKKRLEEFGIRF